MLRCSSGHELLLLLGCQTGRKAWRQSLHSSYTCLHAWSYHANLLLLLLLGLLLLLLRSLHLIGLLLCEYVRLLLLLQRRLSFEQGAELCKSHLDLLCVLK